MSIARIFGIVVCLSVFTCASYAGKNLQLVPHVSKSLTNNFMWTVNATCNIKSNAHGKVRVSVLKNKGVVNGHKLADGQTTFVAVDNNDSIQVSAEPGAQVNLVNMSNNQIEAVCHI